MRLPLALPSNARPCDVLAFGENSVDLIATLDGAPQPDGKHQLDSLCERPGGEAATTAAALARLEWRVKYVGRFGDDRFGRLGRESLARAGVDISGARVIPGARSRTAVILVDRRTGRRTVLWDRDTRVAQQAMDVERATVAGCRVLLVGSDDVAAMSSAAADARAVGTRTVGDIERIHDGTDALLRELDLIVMAEEFPTRFTGIGAPGAALAEIAQLTGAAMVCVTLGERGCLALVNGREAYAPGFATDVVDTTGAGDVFRAGLISAWLLAPEPEVDWLLRYANAAAALACRGTGARGSLPGRSDIERLLHG